MSKINIILILLLMVGCSNPPAPVETPVKKENTARPKATAPKPAANPWKTGSYAPKEGETEGRKFVRLVTEGTYSDTTGTKNTLFAEIIVNKENAGILLRKLKKSAPIEKFSGPVQIKMTSSAGQELNMTSTRGWNSSGGILIERNNNDYTQLRIYLLQNTGTVNVDLRDSGAGIYNFNITLDGFGDSFSTL